MSFIINRISNMSIIPPQLIQKRSSELSLNIGLQNTRKQLFNLKTIQIRNAKKQSYHDKKIILVESLMTLINIFVISITILKNLNSHSSDDQGHDQEFAENQHVQFRFLMVFSVCVGTFFNMKVALNVIRNICIMQFQNQAEKASENKEESYWGFGINIFAQSIFYFIHPSFFTNHLVLTFTNPPFQINKLLSCIVYMRFVIILRFLLKISRFYGLRVNRVLSLYVGDQKDFGMLYTIKCYLKQNGLKSPFIIYGIIIMVFPFFILSVSHKFSSDEENYASSASAFLEAIYDILISMATIGYGDLQHHYGFQRMIFVLIIVMGSLSSTFFTLTFLNWFKLSQQEEKALRSIKRLSLKKEMNDINNKQVQQFVQALVKIQKQKQQNNRTPQMLQKKAQKNKMNHKNLPDLEHNQNLGSSMQKVDMKNLLQKIFVPEKKYLNQRLYDTRDTFKDFYERSQLQLSNSIKMLIERTLLTNNLLEFYLMRQKNHKISENSLISDSSETIKSRKRVDDNKKMYEIRNQIIQSTYHEDLQVKSKNIEPTLGAN